MWTRIKRFQGLVTIPLLVFGAVSCSHELTGPKPSVTDSSLTFCGADQQLFVIKGVDLSPMIKNGAKDNATVALPDVCLTQIAAEDGGTVTGAKEKCLPQSDIQWVSKSELRFTIRSTTGLVPGVYDVVVKNPDGKVAGGTIHLTVLADGPLLFWADPGIAYNGISQQITVYGANLTTLDSVSLRDSTSLQEQPLPFTQTPGKLNRFVTVIPQGTAASTYDITVKAKNGCGAELIRGMNVVSTTDPKLVTAIDPTFGGTAENTPVTITGNGFQQVPRGYLNPQTPAATSGDAGLPTSAFALSSVAYVNGTELTGVVPQGLPTGKYDLVVVNPDGKVGLLSGAFTITQLPPPVVANISPSFIDNGTGPHNVTVEGSNFRTGVKVALSCKAPGATTATAGPAVTVSNIAAAGTSFTATFDPSTLVIGTVCIATVTNTDGSYYTYSALGFANPALNLNPFSTNAAWSMITARRAPAVAPGRATNAARFLYAAGGDNGAPASAYTSVESTQINVYGDPGTFTPQAVSLPEKRTLAGVTTLGRFIYLVGGNTGTAATNTVRRAMVLDPLAAPQIVDVSARRSKTGDGGSPEGIGAGVWYYRVSAVMDPSDPSNPGGETLPSDPLVVNLPTEFQGTLLVTLFWTPVPNAVKYRIYRSPTGVEPLGGVQLLTEVTVGTNSCPAGGTCYEDTAVSGATTVASPRPLGSTGNWSTLIPNLTVAREAPGVAVGADPGTAGRWWLFALGGRSNATTDLASTEKLQITMNADGSQTVGASWTAATALPAARAELTGYSMAHSSAPQITGNATYIYAGGGTGSTSVDGSLLGAGGALTWVAVPSMSPAHSGYGGVGNQGFLFAFGGAQSLPDDSILAGQLDGTALPQLVNWNNNGGNRLTIPRYLEGGAFESANVYLVGGVTTGNVPTKTMEKAVL